MIKLGPFGGEQPRLAPRNLPPLGAQIAQNCDLRSGSLKPWKAPGFEFQTVKAGVMQALYRYDNDGVPAWFHWASDVDVVSSPVINTAGERVYFTGDGWPKLTFKSLATTQQAGQTEGAYPYGAYLLGLPAPDAPTYGDEPVANGGDIVGATAVLFTGSMAFTQSSNPSWPTANVVATGSAPITARVKGYADAVYGSLPAVSIITARITRTGPNGFEVLKTASKTVNLTASSSGVASLSYDFHFTDTPPAGAYEYAFDVLIDGDVKLAADYQIDSASVTNGTTTVTLDRTDHGLSVGDTVQFSGVAGLTQLNGTFAVAGVSGANIIVELDSTQTYTGGGTWAQVGGEPTGSLPEATDANVLTRTYVVTFISDLDDGSGLVQEGPPSLPSDLKTVDPGASVTLNLPAVPDDPEQGSYHITGRYLYRTVTDANGDAEYHFVAELNATDATYTDDLSDGDIAGNEILPSEGWIAPPHDMQGLIELPGGVLAGFHGNEVCLSVPFQPHAWPVAYRQTMHAPIVGLGAFGTSLLVMTSGRPEIINVADPAATSDLWAELTEPCLTKRGIVDMGTAIIYPAPSGLMMVSDAGAAIITKDLWTETDWAALNPASLIAARWGSMYVGFYTTADGVQGGFMLDPDDPPTKLTFLDLAPTAVWNDPATGDLYLVESGRIEKWNVGADATLMRAQSLWRYLQVDDSDNVDRSAVVFDDTEWPQGRAPFGGTAGTQQSVPAATAYDTRFAADWATTWETMTRLWLRRVLPLASVPADGITIICFIEDHCEFYINGQQVFASPPNPTGGNGQTFQIDASALVAGDNVIAVLCHDEEPQEPTTGIVYADFLMEPVNSDFVSTLACAWRSKRFVTRRPLNLGAAQVHANVYPVTFRLFAREYDVATGSWSMALKHETSVADGRPFWLPAGYLSDQWEVEIAGASTVDAVYLAEGIDELEQVA